MSMPEAIRNQYTVTNEAQKHARGFVDTIPCNILDIERDPMVLPALPPLPELPGTGDGLGRSVGERLKRGIPHFEEARAAPGKTRQGTEGGARERRVR
jgi:hypothetical protein